MEVLLVFLFDSIWQWCVWLYSQKEGAMLCYSHKQSNRMFCVRPSL